MRYFSFLLLGAFTVLTALPALARSSVSTIRNGVNTVGQMNGAGSGVGRHDPDPNSPSVYQTEPKTGYGELHDSRRPKYNSSGGNDDD
jgi:hypothetical protein